uniref:aminotransferase class IV family protein n=1 Tax=Alloprevotella sp. TaxID=1872471 RepID=UPI003FF0B67A
MTPQFVETLKMTNGKTIGLTYHQARMERTICHFFPTLANTHMPCLQNSIMPQTSEGVIKVRVVYGAEGIEQVEYIPYVMRCIQSLQIVTDDAIDYSYKSTDRSALNALLAQRGNCDDIIIVKNGLVTDTSFTNIAIYDGTHWLTPRTPLLAGTQRARLLDEGSIQEADITPDMLRQAQKVRLFNAMTSFEVNRISFK